MRIRLKAGEGHPLSQHPPGPFQLQQLAAKAELLQLVESDHSLPLLLLQVLVEIQEVFIFNHFAFIKLKLKCVNIHILLQI